MSRDEGGQYAGWGSDDKGQPVLVVAPPPEMNAATKATRTLASLLLIIVMLVALGIAFLSIAVLSNSIYGEGGYQEQIEAEQNIDPFARQIVEYADELVEDNAEMRATQRATRPLLIPPLLQQIDDLEAERQRLESTIERPRPDTPNRGARPQRNEIPG
jgi:hypothetical protein